MNYSEWEAGLPQSITGDSIWKIRAYRLALFISDIGWQDVTRLASDRRMLGLSDQLYRSLGSISANLAEGYSRGTGKDRAHFYEYALGSTRESRDWYFKARPVLGDEVTNHRMALLAEMVRLLLAMIPNQRGQAIKELSGEYSVEPDISSDSDTLAGLLKSIPFSIDN